MVAGGLALVALEAGWITTEVGRQPWIVFGVMRVEDAVTENGGIWITLVVMLVVYAAMGVAAGARAAVDGPTLAGDRRDRPADAVQPPAPPRSTEPSDGVA